MCFLQDSLPIEIQTFEDIRRKELLYVDKTHYNMMDIAFLLPQRLFITHSVCSASLLLACTNTTGLRRRRPPFLSLISSKSITTCRISGMAWR